jgi:hypothetical protein
VYIYIGWPYVLEENPTHASDRAEEMERWHGGGSREGYIYLLKTDDISSLKQGQGESSPLSYFRRPRSPPPDVAVVLVAFLLFLLVLVLSVYH